MSEHLSGTRRPATYRSHFANAAGGSVRLLVAGLAGLCHAVLPSVFPFFTSTEVIRLFRELVASGRHDNELLHELSGVTVEIEPDVLAPGVERLPAHTSLLICSCCEPAEPFPRILPTNVENGLYKLSHSESGDVALGVAAASGLCKV